MLFYEEKQFLRSNAMIWFAIASLLITFLALVLNFSANESDWIGMLILSIVIVSIVPLLLLASVHLRIEKEGIYIRYFPFHFKPLFFNWSEIDHFELRKYNPLSEYGGWGLKGSKNNRAYNVSGDMGLQITLKSGRKLLVGTANPKKMEVALLEIRSKINL
jgi:Na+/melibiose symporter-like transporter